MFPPAHKEFAKTASCPRSEVLFDFSEGALGSRDSAGIDTHLTRCEFCSIETEMYFRFPLACEEVETPIIPRQLYKLAKALLSGNIPDVLDFTGAVG